MKRSEGRNLQIVIAWTVDEMEIVRARHTDLGERPVMREIKVPRAALWLKSGTGEDLKKAREYAKANGYRAFAYVADEPDPIAVAKVDVFKPPFWWEKAA
jgi:nucleotide-binding universal stress UspA family protein